MTEQKQAPWDDIVGDERTPDAITVFIIFCEDEVSEPIYLRSFQNSLVKVNIIPNQRKGKLNLMATIKRCIKDGLMVFDEGYRLAGGVTENIWCVYDRDFENTDLNLVSEEQNLEWEVSIQNATSAGLRVAWSVDAFELWVLLHFEEITPRVPVHRNHIYSRLTEVFKTLQPRIDGLDAVTSHEMFNYKHAFKSNFNFLTYVLPAIKSRTDQALLRAEVLAGHYTVTDQFHSRNPCTMMFTLVNELLAAAE